MKSALPVLFIVSLIGNVALGVYVLREKNDPSSSPAASLSASAATPNSADAKKTSAVTSTASSKNSSAPAWHAPRTDDDLRGLVANMRAAGYPPSVMRAVVNQLLKERFAETAVEKDQPFWKRTQPTPEMLAAQQLRNNEINDARESILGADGRPSSSLDPVDRARRYGNLSDEKIDALIKLEREHNDVRSMTYAARDKNQAAGMENMQQQQQLLEKEKLADLASVLSPEELSQYEMRSSSAATKVMNNLRTVDVDETEYAALFQAQKAFDANSPALTGNTTADVMAKRLESQSALNEQARAILGEDRFYKYLEGADYQYASVARFTKQYPDLSPQTSYQLYQLQTELQSTMMKRSTAMRASPGAAQQTMDEMRTVQESYASRLSALLPPAALEAYKKQGMGRMFVTIPRTK